MGGEGGAVEQLHGVEVELGAGVIEVVIDVEDAADEGAVDVAGELDFAAEAVDEGGAGGEGGAEEFEGDGAGEGEVGGLIDLAHAAAGDETGDAEACGEEITGGEEGGGGESGDGGGGLGEPLAGVVPAGEEAEDLGADGGFGGGVVDERGAGGRGEGGGVVEELFNDGPLLRAEGWRSWLMITVWHAGTDLLGMVAGTAGKG
jgi:hypothetical protein